MTSGDTVGQPGSPASSPRSLTGRAVSGMFWTFSGTGLQIVAQLLAVMVLGRLVTPTEFGLMGAANVVIVLSQIVSQIGVGPAIIQRQDLNTTHIRVGLTLSFTMGLLLGLVVYFGSPAIAAFYNMPDLEPVLRVVALLFPLDGLNTVGKSLLTRELRFRAYIALEAGSYILGYACLGVLLAWQGFGVWALVFASLGQQLLRTVGMYVATRHSLVPSLDVPAGKALLSYGVGHSIGQIGTLISQQGDNVVVGRLLGAAALGVYGRAYGLVVMPAQAFGRIVTRVLFPIMAQVQGERHRLLYAYERGLAVVALLALPTSAFLWVVAPEFIPLVLGPQWGEVVLPFRLFSIGLLFRMGGKICDACVKAAGVVYSWALLQFLYAALVVGGAIVGLRWGIGGVALCVSFAMAVEWLGMAQLSRSVTGLPWRRFAAAHREGALLAFLIGVAAALVAEAGRSAQLGNLPVVVLAGVGAAIAGGAAARWLPNAFLGQHGVWALRQTQGLVRGRRRAGGPPVYQEDLAPAADGHAKP